MKIHNIEQRSDEWFEIRKLKMTASNATAIANAKDGLKTYIYQICSDNFIKEKQKYTNTDIERGVELEQEAMEIYILETNSLVKEVGFVEYNDFIGCSPDGLVNDDGLIEIKCHNDTNHFKLLITNKIDSKYMWQMQMQMLICGRAWCDYVAYNPNHQQSFYKQRVMADIEKQEKLLTGFAEGENLIKKTLDIYNKINGVKK